MFTHHKYISRNYDPSGETAADFDEFLRGFRTLFPLRRNFPSFKSINDALLYLRGKIPLSEFLLLEKHHLHVKDEELKGQDEFREEFLSACLCSSVFSSDEGIQQKISDARKAMQRISDARKAMQKISDARDGTA